MRTARSIEILWNDHWAVADYIEDSESGIEFLSLTICNSEFSKDEIFEILESITDAEGEKE